MRRPLMLVLSAITLAACSGGEPANPAESSARESSAAPAAAAGPAGGTPATNPRSVAAPVPAPGTSTTAPPAAAATRPVAAGSSRLALEMSAPFEMAGFELHLSFDPANLAAGQPEISPQLQGFLCAANPDIVGGFKYICASVPARRVEGRLAVVPLTWSRHAPTLSAIRVDKVSVVDIDSQPAPKGVDIVLRLVE